MINLTVTITQTLTETGITISVNTIANKYPLLTPLAQDLLSAPASEA